MITFYMTKRMAIRHSLAHWRRMIVWAMAQDPSEQRRGANGYQEMREAIREEPSGNSCALCNKYSGCYYCPLDSIYGNCFSGNAFCRLKESNTWGEWIPIAIKLAAQIESLLYIKKPKHYGY